MSTMDKPTMNRKMTVVPAAERRALELGRPRFELGHWQGLRQPAVLFDLRLGHRPVDVAALDRFDALAAALDLGPRPAVDDLLWTPELATQPVLGRAVRLALQVLAHLGMPVMGGAAAVRGRAGTRMAGTWTVGLPAVSASNLAPQAVFSLVIGLLNVLAQGASVQAAEVDAQVKKLQQMFRRFAPAGINTLRFLQAAHERQVPWRHVVENVYQFGWGSRSRWLDSSFTDRTSRVGATLARDKQACARVLRDLGLPVPRHQQVGSAEQAQKVAAALGYPVVVKAANLDGGVGVFAGLRTPEAVQRAYEAVTKLSRQVLVEQFIEGQDYRLQVFEGEAFWVVLRRPAGVRGDGQATVETLVQRVNAQRAQPVAGPVTDIMGERGSKPIVLDEEAAEWLHAQDLALSSVPAAGRFVRLRGAANVAQGGTREGVPLDAVHPDNRDLVLRGVAALRLDLAGVDLLVPDIGRSWKETGGAICEINAQPQLSAHLQHLLLGRLLQGQGRVPVLGLCVPPGAWDEQAAVQRALAGRGVRLAWVDSARACWQALGDTAVDAVVWSMDEPAAALASMPVDVLDTLVLAHGRGPAGGAQAHPGGPVEWMGLRAQRIWRVGGPAQGADLPWSSLTAALVQHLDAATAPRAIQGDGHVDV